VEYVCLVPLELAMVHSSSHAPRVWMLIRRNFCGVGSRGERL
jgi:hypothetical protein